MLNEAVGPSRHIASREAFPLAQEGRSVPPAECTFLTTYASSLNIKDGKRLLAPVYEYLASD